MESNQQDEIVGEARAARQAYAAQFNYDIRRIIEDIQAKEAQHPELRAGLHPLKPTSGEPLKSR